MDQKKFEEQCFKAHNEYRKAHGAAPLERKKDLSDYAQNWAENMAKNSFGHSDTKKYGENIAYKKQSSDVTGLEMTKLWYDEVYDYDWSTHKSKNNKAVGHFTQVVWKETTHAGFGIAQVGEKYFAVGSYFPPGNMQNAGYYERNVGPRNPSVSLPAPEKGPESGGETPQPGTTVETEVKTITENGTTKKITTTKTITVKKMPGGEYSTTTSTKTQTEILNDVTDELSSLNVGSDDGASNVMTESEMNQFLEEFVEQANKYRQDEGAQSLSKSEEIQKSAQKCADAYIKGQTSEQGAGKAQLQFRMNTRPTGKKAAELIHANRKPEGNDTYQMLMSKDYAKIGVGVASTATEDTLVLIVLD